jgi:hypothetical protein
LGEPFGELGHAVARTAEEHKLAVVEDLGMIARFLRLRGEDIEERVDARHAKADGVEPGPAQSAGSSVNRGPGVVVPEELDLLTRLNVGGSPA